MLEPTDNNTQGFAFNADEFKPRIVLKFHNANPLRAPYDENAHNYLMDVGGERWRQIIDDYQLDVRPAFTFEHAERLQQLGETAQKRAESKDRQYAPPNFFTYFYLDTRTDGEKLTTYLQDAARDLRQMKESVETAYVDRPAADPLSSAQGEPRFAGQTHLAPAPTGIDAYFAWDIWEKQGVGRDVSLIDLERGWLIDHEDLGDLNVQLLYGDIGNDFCAHGTAVLGVVCAGVNGKGGVGVAPNVANANVVSYFNRERHNALAAAICQYDLGNLRAGDVLLIEVQAEIDGPDGDILAPVDVYQADFDLVLLASHLGIVVVEAGGNGTDNGFPPALNLDALVPALPDSGAIIVSAVTSDDSHCRLPYAPYGDRIDCYAWGEKISTCFWDGSDLRDRYQPDQATNTPGFGGTSGAAAIIAGAMIVLQGIARIQGLEYDAWEWRPILHDPEMGTPVRACEDCGLDCEDSAAGYTPNRVMPDLHKIINRHLELPQPSPHRLLLSSSDWPTFGMT